LAETAATVYDVSRHLSPMSRDITKVERIGFEPTTPCLQSRCATSCATAPRMR
jgi:hypothetical protein